LGVIQPPPHPPHHHEGAAFVVTEKFQVNPPMFNVADVVELFAEEEVRDTVILSPL
jgi:hypothetical protein